ncbi:MAG: response regulator [Candidatus Latescibacteria bacterium]|nr:response regulator [Candidatus Latescibacterota bacterium]
MTGTPKPATILLVDDEEMVLTSLKSFLALETEYRAIPFLSPGQALSYARGNEVNLVISDFLMPEMDGISFLARMRELRPDATRIILTGYADKENAIKAINEVGIFQYIEKPWDNDQLLIAIRNGLEKQRMLKNLEEKIAEINKAYADLSRIQQEILKTFA